MKNLFAAMLALNLLTGCASIVRTEKDATPMPTREAQARGWPAVLDSGDRQQIRATAVADARADIAAGKPRVAWTGGFACSAMGVPMENIGLVKNLPNIPLPCGCTEPLLEQASIYAEAYNKEVLPYLLKRNEFHR